MSAATCSAHASACTQVCVQDQGRANSEASKKHASISKCVTHTHTHTRTWMQRYPVAMMWKRP
eukprot:1151493-Pelagomonas_calceolata.AAC.10